MKILCTRTAFALALGTTVLLVSACKNEPESMNTGTNDPMAAELANAAPPPPLPMIKSSHPYRCKDNSLIYVDFMTDDVSANFKADKAAPFTALKAPEKGKPFVSADGKTTVEAGSESTITYNGQSCKAG
jgi:hypothetical protein